MTQNKINSLRPYFGFIAVVLTIIILLIVIPKNNTPDPTDELQNIAIKINLQTPKLLDSVTRLDSVKVLPGDIFLSSITLINLTKEMIDTNRILTEGKQLFTNHLKNGYGFAYFKTYKIPLVYNFYDSSGVYVCRFRIEPGEYQ